MYGYILTKSLVFLVGLEQYLLVLPLPCVRKPILYLFLRQTCLFTQLLLIFLVNIWVLDVVQEPLLHYLGCLSIEYFLLSLETPFIVSLIHLYFCVLKIIVPVTQLTIVECGAHAQVDQNLVGINGWLD